MTDLHQRQRTIDDVIARFRKIRPGMQVQIRLYPCSGEQPETCRGIINPVDVQAQAVPDTTDNANLPPPLADESQLPELRQLAVGQCMHLAVTSAFRGILHLFNLGTTGSVGILFPHEDEHPEEIPPNTRLFITGGKASPFKQSPYREKGDSETNELGRANGYPERLLAIVTRDNIRLKPGTLFPDWSAYDLNYRGTATRGWDQLGTKADSVWDMPEDAWQWGLLEVPVVDSE